MLHKSKNKSCTVFINLRNHPVLKSQTMKYRSTTNGRFTPTRVPKHTCIPITLDRTSEINQNSCRSLKLARSSKPTNLSKPKYTVHASMSYKEQCARTSIYICIALRISSNPLYSALNCPRNEIKPIQAQWRTKRNSRTISCRDIYC